MILPKFPSSPAEWASLALGVGLVLVGIAHWLQGNITQASLDFSGAFGTLGLPSLAGSGWHVEVRKDLPA